MVDRHHHQQQVQVEIELLPCHYQTYLLLAARTCRLPCVLLLVRLTFQVPLLDGQLNLMTS